MATQRERETGARQAHMSLIIAFSPSSKSKYAVHAEKSSGVSMFGSLRHDFTVYNVIECVFAMFLAIA